MSWQDLESACPNLAELTDQVTSAANRAIDSIVSTITDSPTAGTAAAIGAKISSAIDTAKAEAEALLETAKGTVAEIEQTLQEYAAEIQSQIEEIEEQLIDAVGEIREQLLQQIEDLKGQLQEVIPPWLNKSPEELLNDVINHVCDPEVNGLGKPTEGIAKKVIPSTAPAENPAGTEVEVFAAPSKPPVQVNPIKL